MNPSPRMCVVIDAPTKNCPVFIARVKTILGCVSAASAELKNPNPPLATLESELSDLEIAQQAVVAKTPGSVALRDAKLRILRTSIETLRMYVQGLCDASPAQAATLIAAAGMKALERKPVNKPVLTASLEPVSGQVKLRANRTELLGKTRRGAVFAWQSSIDGGKTWVSAPATSVAKTVITGLPPLTEVAFRVSASTTKVVGAWSQVVTTVVR